MPADPSPPAPHTAPRSLYLHAPYCRSRCGYCAFASAALPAAPDWRGYAQALAREAELWGETLARPRIETVFYGGGTPSLIPPAHFASIFTSLRAHFDIVPDAEITCEANPESATPEFLATARACGVNRLSLGVQSLDDGMLRLLGRAHDAQGARRAVENARAAGFGNLGLDLIWGLPGQSLEHWLGTLRAALALGPEHLSCYALSVEPGTPLRQGLERALAPLPALPPDEVLERMFLEGAELLEDAGFTHYEVSNFSLPGPDGQPLECRHNSLTWEGARYLGLGPAAVGTLDVRGRTLRWANPADPARWREGVLRMAGAAPPPDAEFLDADTLRREGLMLGLRTRRGAPLSAFAHRQELVERLLSGGLALAGGGRLTLTRRGLLVSSAVIAELVFG